MDLKSTEQVQTTANPVDGGIEEVIQCLIDWLDSQPNEEKSHQILRALAKESKKKTMFIEEEKRRFTGEEICATANVNPKDPPNKWINWNNAVLPYWEARKPQIIELARKQGLAFYPEPVCLSTKGGQGRKTTYVIRKSPLPELTEENKKSDSMSALASDLSQVFYELEQTGEVKPAFFARWLFQDGAIRLTRWHLWVIALWLFVIGGGAFLLSYVGLIALTVPKPITTRELTTVIFIFVIPYLAWVFSIKPWVHLFDDRIIPAPELLVALKEKPAQVELFRDGDLRLLRLVRYYAPCPVCGATLYIEDGAPDFTRRMVGRCSESPREHIYSFDRVTRKGKCLRIP